ncbi:hypothetical protein EDC94DRAFT_627344 [Helicostylum pulchrum]|nr:hypothetical protein EDC94DRAFT_627344 [Helicostylum pulchrum]
MIDDEPMLDSCIGEVARHATAKKKFNDKLKAAIASKCHLNTFLKTMPYIRAKDAPLVKIPVIQIARFSAKLSALNLPKKKRILSGGCLLFFYSSIVTTITICRS